MAVARMELILCQQQSRSRCTNPEVAPKSVRAWQGIEPLRNILIASSVPYAAGAEEAAPRRDHGPQRGATAAYGEILALRRQLGARKRALKRAPQQHAGHAAGDERRTPPGHDPYSGRSPAERARASGRSRALRTTSPAVGVSHPGAPVPVLAHHKGRRPGGRRRMGSPNAEMVNGTHEEGPCPGRNVGWLASSPQLLLPSWLSAPPLGQQGQPHLRPTPPSTTSWF